MKPSSNGSNPKLKLVKDKDSDSFDSELHIRLTSQMLAQFIAKAHKLGLKPSTYGRMLIAKLLSSTD